MGGPDCWWLVGKEGGGGMLDRIGGQKEERNRQIHHTCTYNDYTEDAKSGSAGLFSRSVGNYGQ